MLAPHGCLVLTDLFSWWLAPTLLLGHRGHARTKQRAQTLLNAAGFRTVSWQRVYTLILATAVASK